jgi:hypothetical protein
MKSLLILAASGALALSPASAVDKTQDALQVDTAAQISDPALAPRIAPTLPLTADTDAKTVAAPAPAQKTDLANLGSGTAPASTAGDTWETLDDTSRYLLIMGSADGFSAAGPGSPCFPGRDNAKIDATLRAGAFAKADPDGLPEAMKAISDAPETCKTTPTRGYTANLLKTMPDKDLAVYLTGLVRSYARIKPCVVDNQGYAAAMVAAAIFTASDAAQPNQVIAPAIAEGCKGSAGK